MKDFLQPSRQRFLLVALAWGLGCGIAISCLLFGVYFYSQLPRSWNTRALRVHKVSAGATSRFNDQLEEVSTGLTFTVALENMTNIDITLPQTVRIMEAESGTGTLTNSLLTLNAEYFIPAGHTVAISFSNSELCAKGDVPQECFNRYFRQQSEIVIFDEPLKYEVRILIPAFTDPK